MDVHVPFGGTEGVGIHEGKPEVFCSENSVNFVVKVLHEHGFPVPSPIDQARHCVLMEFIDAYPL
jgi:hypothetical protein